jgi:hypothetical protein
MLTWDALPGAMFYRVVRSSSLEPHPKTIATGLTSPAFSEPAPVRGEAVTYTVLGVNANGPGAPSDPIKLTPRKAIPIEQ